MSYDLASRLKGLLLRTGPTFMPDRWSAPRLLTFMMTYRCNLRCTMCWQWGEQGLFHELTKDHEIQQLDLATLRSVIADVARDGGLDPAHRRRCEGGARGQEWRRRQARDRREHHHLARKPGCAPGHV